MPLEKVIKKVSSSGFFLPAVFIILFLITRLPFLGSDTINPDAVNWHFRSERFIEALKQHWWDRTYQHYHPGVTLMWIMGSVIEIARRINPDLRVYNKDNFLLLHTLAKYSLVFVQLIISLGLMGVLGKILDRKKSFILVAFFSLEPFFIGNSRLLHLDVLLTLLLFLGLVLGFLGGQGSKKYAFLSGISLGLAFLTKSVAIGGLLLVSFYFFWSNYKNISKTLILEILCLGGFLFIIFAIFPAMWVSPTSTFKEILNSAERVGVRKGHEQIFFGVETTDPGIFFYPVLVFLKTSPILFGGLVLALISLIPLFPQIKNLPYKLKNFPPKPDFGLLMFIFLIGYFIGITYSTKKIDRYLIPVFPALAYFSLLGYQRYIPQAKKNLAILVSLSGLLLLNFAFYPYQFTYFSPLVGNAKNAHWIIAQKPFGIGVPLLKNRIISNYGFASLAFYDPKPMSMIYPSSKIFDIEIDGTRNYDIIVLGPNEKIPASVLKSGNIFDFDEAIHINGLDYWRIYVKRGFTQR